MIDHRCIDALAVVHRALCRGASKVITRQAEASPQVHPLKPIVDFVGNISEPMSGPCHGHWFRCCGSETQLLISPILVDLPLVY